MKYQKEMQVEFCGQIEAEDFRHVKLTLRITWKNVFELSEALKSMIQDSKDHYSIRRACRLLDELDYIYNQSLELHKQAKL